MSVFPHRNSGRQTLTNDIVSERILNQSQGMESDLRNELNSLRVGSVIDASLQDATTVSMSRYFNTVSCYGIVYELRMFLISTWKDIMIKIVTYLVVFRNQPVQTFLNDMVSVEILDQSDNVQAQCHDDASDLSRLSWTA